MLETTLWIMKNTDLALCTRWSSHHQDAPLECMCHHPSDTNQLPIHTENICIWHLDSLGSHWVPDFLYIYIHTFPPWFPASHYSYHHQLYTMRLCFDKYEIPQPGRTCNLVNIEDSWFKTYLYNLSESIYKLYSLDSQFGSPTL